MKHKLKGSLLFILSISLFIASCHKENTSFDYNMAIETVSDYVDTQQMTNLLLNTYFKSITDSTLITDGIAEIDGADVNYSADPAIITILYSWAKYDSYGHLRKGKYEASTESSFFDSLAIININFSNFFYDSSAISVGNFSIENMGTTTNNNYLFKVEATDILIKYHDSTGNISYQVEQNYLRVKNPSTPYHTNDDYFRISGNMTGIARNNNSFTSSTQDTNNLLVYYSCPWIKGGTAEIELPGFIYNASVDFFNDGECRNHYSIITNETLFLRKFDPE